MIIIISIICCKRRQRRLLDGIESIQLDRMPSFVSEGSSMELFNVRSIKRD
jgi:hypothetical protein